MLKDKPESALFICYHGHVEPTQKIKDYEGCLDKVVWLELTAAK